LRGFLLLNKAEGKSSFDALSPIKKALGTKKIGHCGTLDKFATGLLIVLVGNYTRLNPWFTGLDKEYLAEIRFGTETNTLDIYGKVVKERPLPDKEQIVEALKTFVGEISQVPPEYSAIHINGVRAYKMALSGDALEMAPRKVRIEELELLDMAFYGEKVISIRIRVLCSKGTYIRSLARDIGEAVNSCGYLTYLKRNSIGPFLVSDSVEIEDISKENLKKLDPHMAMSLGLTVAFIDEKSSIDFINGRKLGIDRLRIEYEKGQSWAVFSEKTGELLGMVENRNRFIYYIFVLRDEA
jgi:tRNA pseudouridine55 synthase